MGTYVDELVEAANKGDLDQLKEILNINPSCINEVGKDGYTALIIAAYSGKEDCVDELVSADADLTPKDKDGTALENAMVQNRKECVEILLKAGSPVENLSEKNIVKYATLIEKYCPELWSKVKESIKEKAKKEEIKQSFKPYEMVNDFIVMKCEGKVEGLGKIHTMFNLRAQTVTEIINDNPATARDFNKFTRDNSEEIVKAYDFSIWKGKKNKQPFKKVDRVKI